MTNNYSLKGEILTNYGARVYPVGYTYDAQGRRKTMITWKNFAARSGAATTTWNYDTNRGFLISKVYDDGRGTTNSYTAGGRPFTRTWARGIVTTYHTNAAGQAWATTYSDGTTPAVTNHFDRLGRVTNVLDGAGSRSLSYDPAGRLLMETNASGVLSGVALLHAYDALGRRTNVSVHNSSTPLLQHSYRFDAASRLTNAADGPFSATYAYLANSPLVSQITHRSNSVTAMTTTKSYDYLNRLLSIANVPSAAGETPITYAYLYNDANQRTRRTDPDDSYWLYEYDSLGQLTSGKHYWQDHTPVAGQQFEYAYDDIGNRTSTKEGGDQVGAALRAAQYSANSLNQYTNRTVPGAADITGIAHASASVTNNGQAAYRKGEYFWNELSIHNTNTPVWTNVITIASLTGTNQTNAGNLLHPKATELSTFDADGNQTSDSLWTNSWDGENRLIMTESASGVPVGGKARQAWTLDGQSRWVQRVIYTWNGSAYVASATNRFLWDGKILLAILDHTNGIAQSYLRGLDLSASPQGAGGAGGVLAVNLPTNGTHFLAYDGSGNVAGMANATSGAITGRYAYDPFANTLELSGTAAQANLIRFSTQLADAISGEVKYLYRGNKASIGRWPNRDPIEETGGRNLYCYVDNSTTGSVDTDGRRFIEFVSASIQGEIRQCGGWEVTWKYVLGVVPFRAYVVQEVTITEQYNNCGRSVVHQTIVFYEAKLVTPSEPPAPGEPPAPKVWYDSDALPGHPRSFGRHSVTAVARVFREADAPGTETWPGVRETPHRPSTYAKPTWWDTARVLDTDTRTTSRDWSCCCDTREGVLVHTP